MLRISRAVALLQILLVSLLFVDPVTGQAADETLVPIAPCRILDTAATPPSQPGEDAARTVDIRSSRCGRIIPSVATGYAIRMTRISKTPPDELPAGTLPVIEPPQKIAAPADGRLSFPIPANDFLAVDIYGYYVPRGAPVRATTTTSPVADEAASKSAPAPESAPTTNIVHSGDKGEIYLDGSIDSTAGVLMTGASATPWVAAKSITADGASGFVVTNDVNASILRVRGDGVVQLAGSTNFFDGRTDFFGSPTFISAKSPSRRTSFTT